MSIEHEMKDETRDVQQLWSSVAIVLGIALILTAWLTTDLSAESKAHGFGKAPATGNSGISQIPVEPAKTRPGPNDPYKVRSVPAVPHTSVGNDRGIIIVSGKAGKDASATLDAKRTQQGIKVNPGGPVELNPQPLPPKEFQRSIKINPGEAVGLNPQPLPPKWGRAK